MRKSILVLPVFFASTAFAEPPGWLERYANPRYEPRQIQRQQAAPRASVRTPEAPVVRVSKPGATRESLPDAINYFGNVIIVYRSSQQYAAYSNGTMIMIAGVAMRGPVSTGTNDRFRTPLTQSWRGPHRIEYKQIDYESSTYPEPDGGAPMPFAMFFNRKEGLALHAGDIPSWRGEYYGVSHGCVRLPLEHARILYHHFSDRSVRVIIVESVGAFRAQWEIRPDSPF